MFMTSTVTATSGSVAPVEFSQSRAVAPAVGHGGAASHDVKASEPAMDLGAQSRAVAAGSGDKSGKTATVNPASNAAGSAHTNNSAFNFDSTTRRVVMQVRDGSGSVVIQIPSEQALRQYEQALKRSQDSVTQDVAPAASPAGADPVSPPSTPVAASSGSVTAGFGARYNIVV